MPYTSRSSFVRGCMHCPVTHIKVRPACLICRPTIKTHFFDKRSILRKGKSEGWFLCAAALRQGLGWRDTAFFASSSHAHQLQASADYFYVPFPTCPHAPHECFNATSLSPHAMHMQWHNPLIVLPVEKVGSSNFVCAQQKLESKWPTIDDGHSLYTLSFPNRETSSAAAAKAHFILYDMSHLRCVL